MAKRKHRKIVGVNIRQSILQSLRTDFRFDEEKVQMIDLALHQKRIPHDIADYITQAAAGNVPLPIRRPIDIDMGDGEIQRIKINNNTVTLLLDYLCERYGWAFGSLYWSAITTSSPKDFYALLKHSKNTPIMQRHLVEEEGMDL